MSGPHPRFFRFHGPSKEFLFLLEQDEADEDAVDFFKYYDITIINQVLKDFFTEFPIASLIRRRAEFENEAGVKYTHEKCRYSGSIHDFRCFTNDGRFQHRLTVRLSSDGFLYPPLSRDMIHDQYAVNRGYGGWAYLKQAFLQDKLPFLQDIAEAAGVEKIKFLYNRRNHRIDIHLMAVTSALDDDPMMLIALEPGNPDSIPKDEYFAHFRLKRQAH